MGWIVKERRQSAREEEAAKILEGQGWMVITAGRFCSQQYGWLEEEAWWQRVARQVLGNRIVVLSSEELISDFSQLRELSRLSHLGLSLCKYVRDFTPLMRLTTLKDLALNGTSITDLSPLATLAMLENLDLHGTRVVDLSPIAGLVRLKQLELSSTPIRDVRPLARLTNLERLNLNNTEEVSDFTPLSNLKGLQWLDIRATNASRESVRHLQSMLPNCEIEHDFSD
jgi:internalin A